MTLVEGPFCFGLVPQIRATRVLPVEAWELSTVLSTNKEDSDAASTMKWGLSTSFVREIGYEQSLALGAQILLPGQFGPRAHVRKTCCLGQWNELYWGYGASGRYKTSDFLAGLLKVSSYNAEAVLGFESLVNRSRRLRSEFTVGYGMLGVSMEARLGYAFF